MALKDAEQRLAQSTSCKFADFISSLDKDDSKTLAEWISAQRPAGWIARVVSADGRPLNEKTVKRHLDGHCKCPVTSLHRGAYGA